MKNIIKALNKELGDLPFIQNIIYLLKNFWSTKTQKEAILNFARKNGLAIIDFVPFDQNVVESEMRGNTPLEQKESTAVQAIEALSEKIIAKDN